MTYYDTQFTDRIRISPKQKKWLMDNFKEQEFKSAAAFLEQIIIDYQNPNLFKKRKA